MTPTDPGAAAALALFERVMDLPPEARAAVLREAGAANPGLRARVEQLLAWDAREHTTLDGDAAQLSSVLLDEPVDGPEEAGWEIGSYRILAELGRGGMGAVYLAERADGEFRKEVAVKVVKRGMDTDEILARFRHERHILASLEHPNIARLYDGGVTGDGRPFLVMERVDGEPLTSYCDRMGLDVDRRLQIFITVCRAVQYAHQNMVIHRDLKPSNILVTKDGVPKLLDFGIAKLLDDQDPGDPLTRTGLRVLTPEYASPEQLRGEPVTTASDVYALGTLLHEVLAGVRPHSAGSGTGSGLGDASPARPSSRVGRLAVGGGSSPENLRPDAEAVAAARGTTPDRLRRRLTGDLDTILLRALEPDPARRYATVQEFLEDIERHRASLPIRARPPSAAYLLQRYVRRHRGAVASGAVVLASLVGGLGVALWQARTASLERDAAELARARSEQVAGFLVNLFESTDPLGVRPDRGDTLPVRELVDRGAERVRLDLAGQPRLQADLLTLLGRVYVSLGNYPRAEELLRDAMVMNREADAPALARAVPVAVLASAAQQQGEISRADSLLRDVLAVYEREGVSPDSLYLTVLTDHGLALTHLGRYPEAEETQKRVLVHLSDLGWTGSSLHGRVLTNLALLHYDQGGYAEAATLFGEAARIEAEHLPPGHPRRAATLNNLASSLHYQGFTAEAEPLYLEAITVARSALGDTHPDVGNYLQNLATLYDDQARYEEAAELYRASLVAHEASLGRRNVNTALLLRNLALNRFAVGELAEAEALLREALESMQEGLGGDHLYTAVTQAALGRVLLATGEVDRAEGFIRGGLATLETQLPAEHHLVNASRRDLGAFHTARGEYTTAEELLLASYAALLADRGADHYLAREARERLRELYLAWGRPDRAAEFEAETVIPVDGDARMGR